MNPGGVYHMKWMDKFKTGKGESNMKTQSTWNGVKKALQASTEGLKDAGKGVGKTRLTRSVGLKLFLIIFSSIVACVLAVGLYSYSVSKDIIKKKVSQASQETIAQTASKLDLMYANYEALTMQLLVDNNLQSLSLELSRGGLDDFEEFQSLESIDNVFQTFLLSNSRTVYGGAMIPLADYLKPITSGNSQLDVAAAMETDWYKKAIESKERPYWIPTQPAGLNGKQAKPTFGLTRLIKSINTGEPLYLLVLEFDYRNLSEQLGDISLGTDSDLYIVGADGAILYAEDQSEIGGKLDLTSADKPSGSFTGLHKGMHSLGVYQQFDELDWRLIGMIPVDSLVEDAKEIRNLTWIAAIVAGLLAVGIGLLVIRMIAVPLGQLRNLMNEGEKGNLSIRSSIDKQDEIGQLAQSFNQMMTQITSLVDQTNRSAQEVLQTASDLSEASKKTAVSAKEIAVATEEIANGATSLAVEAEKGSGLTDDMGVRMANVNEAGGLMAASATEVEKASEQGTRYMAALIEKTGMTEDMTRSMVEKVDKLKDSTRSIRKILDVLNNLTKQTNILSLNATIEAARAGAAGKGFMVVADEIRKLADQSRQSIDVVAQITETIQREIDDTVGVLSEAYPLFREQIESVKEANQIFLSVQTQMGSFVGHLDTVTASVGQLGETQSVLSEAMGNVSAVAQQASATSEEVASLSNEQLSISEGLVELSNKLETVSTQLKETLSRFRTNG